jgi:glycosyltransferase involved in cell wall biosynthesis
MMTQMRDLKGVKEHGRVDQVTLAKEMLTSGVFAYPCHFEEISCISAMKAQVAGCTPLTTNYSALAETNLCELYKIDGNPKASEEVIEKFKTKLLEVLKTPMTDDQRIELSGLAMHKFSWKNVAKEWSKFCQEAK